MNEDPFDRLPSVGAALDGRAGIAVAPCGARGGRRVVRSAISSEGYPVITRITPFSERLRQRKRMILFICTGNTCRSPMAAGYFRKLLEERGIKDIEVRSAGVMTVNGLLASPEAVQVMESVGVDLRRHYSTPLTPELIQKADLILAMTPFHRQTAVRMSEAARAKTFLLKEFTQSDLKNVQIADPMGGTLEVFKKCFKEIREACDRLIDHEFIRNLTASSRKSTPPAKPREPRPAAESATSKAGSESPARSDVKSDKTAAAAAAPAATKSKTAPKPAAAKQTSSKPAARPAVEGAGGTAAAARKDPAAKAPARKSTPASTGGGSNPEESKSRS